MEHLTIASDNYVAFTFFIGTMAMMAASVFFLFEVNNTSKKWRTSVLVSGLITFIAAIHYYYMRGYNLETGESPTLSHNEHEKVIELCVKESNGKLPVFAGTGSNSTEEAISLTSHAEKIGADGALIVTPYYNKPTQEGLYQHYKAINDKCGIPIIIYNIPGRSVIDMSVETMARLYELKNIIGNTLNILKLMIIVKHMFLIWIRKESF